MFRSFIQLNYLIFCGETNNCCCCSRSSICYLLLICENIFNSMASTIGVIFIICVFFAFAYLMCQNNNNTTGEIPASLPLRLVYKFDPISFTTLQQVCHEKSALAASSDRHSPSLIVLSTDISEDFFY